MSQNTQDPALRAATIPCPTCSCTGTDTYEDRHTGTNMDTCRTCGGNGYIAARTGETPEASYQPALSATPAHAPGKAGDREGLERARAAFDRWFAATGLDTTHRGLTACAYHAGFSAGALAPSPTGNEAPRGADDGWRSKAADEVEGIAGLWEGDGRSYAMAIAAILRSEEPAELTPADEDTKRIVTRAWERFQQGVAAPSRAPDAGRAETIRSADLSWFATAAAKINDSPALTSVYAAPAWDELSEDGQCWVAALVRETLAMGVETPEFAPPPPVSTEPDSRAGAEREALADIGAERCRQVERCGWSLRHDDSHDCGELASAAACYALSHEQRWILDASNNKPITHRLWPWDAASFRPRDRREELVVVGALIVAEIERLDRRGLAAAPPSPPTTEPDSRADAEALSAAILTQCDSPRICACNGRVTVGLRCGPCEYKLLQKLLAGLHPSPPTASGAAAPVGERVRHLKRGTEYEVIGEAEAQVSTGYTDGWGTSATIRDGSGITVYRDPKSGKLWCRFTDEFRDGRFETTTPTPAPHPVPAGQTTGEV